jgi:hypothetical protein
MESDDMRQLQRQAMQSPFRIRMTGGEEFDVRHHDFMTVSDYHAAIVVPENGRQKMHLITLVNISSIEMLPTAARN